MECRFDESCGVGARHCLLVAAAHIFQRHFSARALIVSNDGDTPIALTDLKIEFVTVMRDKLAPQELSDLLAYLMSLK